MSEDLDEYCFKCIKKCLKNDTIRFFIIMKLLDDAVKTFKTQGEKKDDR